jgi:hypothetical protein
VTCHFPARKLAIILLTSILSLTSAIGYAENTADDDLDDLMGGFEDEDEDEGDDLMGGFGDDLDAPDTTVADEEIRSWLARLPYGEVLAERVRLSGSISAGTEYSYLDHKVPHGDEVGRSTSYGNLTRLDLDAFLQLDVQLPLDWQIRAEAQGWYDFVYRIKGRSNYGGAVLDVYEWQVDTGEVYLTGPLHKNVDLTLGRKVVNWGRSDTFRVVDVINPLDNKEPGLVDIEDLRRPVMMAKLDVTSGPWSGQFLVIPENRYNRNPPQGSDWFLKLTPAQAAAVTAPIDDRSNFSGTPGIAGKIDGRFSGWDFSLYGAYTDESNRVVDAGGSTGVRREANRHGLVGAAGNVTRGAWLVKVEMAWLRDVRVVRFQTGSPIPLTDDNDRIDTMFGVEYYGRDDLAIAVEIVNRHQLDENTAPGTSQLNKKSVFQSSVRITRPFFRERMNVTALAIGFGERLQNGGLLRFSSDYELTDAWKAEAGILIFIGGPDDGIGAYDSNDRLYAEIKYSF